MKEPFVSLLLLLSLSRLLSLVFQKVNSSTCNKWQFCCRLFVAAVSFAIMQVTWVTNFLSSWISSWYHQLYFAHLYVWPRFMPVLSLHPRDPLYTFQLTLVSLIPDYFSLSIFFLIPPPSVLTQRSLKTRYTEYLARETIWESFLAAVYENELRNNKKTKKCKSSSPWRSE